MSEKLPDDVIEALDWAFESNNLYDRIIRKQDKIDDVGRIANSGGDCDQARELQDDIRGEKLELERRFETIQIAVGSIIGRQVEGSDTLFAPKP